MAKVWLVRVELPVEAETRGEAWATAERRTAELNGMVVSCPHMSKDEAGLANARLIAAAPDLLEACKEARSVIASFPARHSTTLTPSEWEARQKLEQAIAAATESE